MKKLFFLFFLALTLAMPVKCRACDETLVMLLTAKNPNSEFSKTIRRVATYLSHLGARLKAGLQEDYTQDLELVMSAWLEFTTRYMTNPPEEARSDKNWAEKVRKTSETIGKIRKLILAGERMKAHDQVLELSSSIGKFFEAIGITPEKQLFLLTSTNLTLFEQRILAEEREPALASIASLSVNLNEFRKIIPDVAASTAASLETSLAELRQEIASQKHIKTLDPQAVELRTMFEELRSHILMNEWFPQATDPEQEEKK